jgi:hypothetical protein
MTYRGKDISFPRTIPALARLAFEHDYGRAWYTESGESIAEYSESVGKTQRYVSDVLAILSPRVSVRQNVRLTKRYIETGTAPGAMKARLVALAKYETTGVFTGPKVTAFSAALQGDSEAVVVDAWVYRLLGVKPSRQSYGRSAAVVVEVSQSLGWQPAETQAALWCGARALCGLNDKYSPINMEVAA